jgi:hypothetical protein
MRNKVGTRTVWLLAGAILLGGCGGSDFKNDPRPPTPIQLTGVITDKSVTISPNRLGAGPIVLIISNQAHAAHTVTLDGNGIKDQVGPINPLDTAKLQQDLRPGQYKVSAGSSRAVAHQVKPGTIVVGPERQSSSNTVLLP